VTEPHADVNVRHVKPSRIKDYLCGAGLILLVGAGLWMYIAYCLNEIDEKTKLEELKSLSQAHMQILNSYHRCMGVRSPGHMACLGSVAKAAELYGYKPAEINRVFADAGLLGSPDAINRASPAHR
jgi:hypothetical protein